MNQKMHKSFKYTLVSILACFVLLLSGCEKVGSYFNQPPEAQVGKTCEELHTRLMYLQTTINNPSPHVKDEIASINTAMDKQNCNK